MLDTCRVHRPYQKSLWDHIVLPWGRVAPGKSDGVSPPVASSLSPNFLATPLLPASCAWKTWFRASQHQSSATLSQLLCSREIHLWVRRAKVQGWPHDPACLQPAAKPQAPVQLCPLVLSIALLSGWALYSCRGEHSTDHPYSTCFDPSEAARQA